MGLWVLSDYVSRKGKLRATFFVYLVSWHQLHVFYSCCNTLPYTHEHTRTHTSAHTHTSKNEGVKKHSLMLLLNLNHFSKENNAWIISKVQSDSVKNNLWTNIMLAYKSDIEEIVSTLSRSANWIEKREGKIILVLLQRCSENKVI